MSCIDAYNAYGSAGHLGRANTLWDQLYTYQVLNVSDDDLEIQHNNVRIMGKCDGGEYISFSNTNSIGH
jgi:hypothetical protein